MASPAKRPQGNCVQCDAPNPYSSFDCSVCGARLPWADAVEHGKEKARGAGSMFIITGCLVLTGLAITGLIVLYSLVAAGVIALPHAGGSG